MTLDEIMKNFIIYTFFLLSPACLYAKPEAEGVQKKRDEVYDRLSTNVFLNHASIQRSSLPRKDKEAWMKNGSSAAFYYWVTTREGGVQKSERVDDAIAFLYEVAVTSKMTNSFSDPLSRIELDTTDFSLVGFPNMSKKEYEECIEGFLLFLKDGLKKRKKNIKR